MTPIRSLTLALALAFLLPACSKKDDAQVAAAAIASDPSAPLAFVPADTPYVMANLARTPNQITDVFVNMMAPVGEGMRESLARIRAKTAADTTDESKREKNLALLDLFQDKTSLAGWERIGFRRDGLIAFYGVGLMPVLRIELADPSALRAFIAELEQTLGEQAPLAQIDGRDYWRFQPKPEEDFAMVVAILDQHLVVTVDIGKDGPPLTQLLGLSRPERSMQTSGELDAINRQYGLLPYGTVLLDNRRLLSSLLGGPDGKGGIAYKLSQQEEPISQVCRDELAGLAAASPRVVSGYPTLNDERLSSHTVFELRTDLAQGLMPLAAPVPGLGSGVGKAVMEFGFGLKLDKLAEFIQAQASAIRSQPYQCAWLVDLNDAAQNVGQQMAALYMAAGWFTGVRVVLNELRWDGEKPEAVEGAVVIASPNPGALVSMLQGFVPQAAQLDLGLKSPPQRIDPRQFGATDLPQNTPPAFAAVREGGIGLALGERAERELLGYLAAPAPTTSPLLYMGYDGATYAMLMKKFDALSTQMTADATDETMQPMSQDASPPPHKAEVDELMEPIVAAFNQISAMVKYVWLDLNATERGLELRYETQLN